MLFAAFDYHPDRGAIPWPLFASCFCLISSIVAHRLLLLLLLLLLPADEKAGTLTTSVAVAMPPPTLPTQPHTTQPLEIQQLPAALAWVLRMGGGGGGAAPKKRGGGFHFGLARARSCYTPKIFSRFAREFDV